MSIRIFNDLWRSEKAQNYITLMTSRGVSEATIYAFASMFWGAAIKAYKDNEAEIREAQGEEE